MKHAYFVALFLCLTLSLLSQSNPVSPTHQTVGVASVIGAPPISAPPADPQAQARILDSYGKLPLSFEANHGQADGRVKFLSRTGGYTLFLTGDQAVLVWSGSAAKKPAAKGAPGFGGDTVSLKRYPDTKPNLTAAPGVTGGVLRMKLLHANPKTEVSGQDELRGKSNYFIGNDPKKWHTNVRQFAKVRYGNVYPGVDLVYYAHQRELEYDFVLRPGASPQAIRLGIQGATRLRLEHGDLVLTSASGDVHLRSPHIYQEANGVRRKVRGGYVIKSKNEVGFEVAEYDRRRALIIDPVLAYSTFLGGSSVDLGKGIAVDSAGNAYVVGVTYSWFDFPTTPGAFQTTTYSYVCAFVTKLNADGSALVYSTYLGGAGSGSGIAVDSAGNAYVTGTTDGDFPTVNAIQPTYGGGSSDGFVTKINAEGNALIYSTFLGGSAEDTGNSIAVNSVGNAYVTGYTYSDDFPTKNAIQPTNHGGGDGFVTKINASGSALVYSTYLGGGDYDVPRGIAVDSGRNAYVTGSTQSNDFPTTTGAFQRVCGGSGGSGCHYWTGGDAFVTKINAAGSAFVYSTYLGGSGPDGGSGIAVDSAGHAYVAGSTASGDFPTANALQPSPGGGYDAFLAKLNTTGSALVYSTYLGTNYYDYGSGIAVDLVGNAYVTGYTESPNFPMVNAIQPTFGGGTDDTFVTKFNAAGSALAYSTYLGGNNTDKSGGIAVDLAGSAYVTGNTSSGNFPKTIAAFQHSLNNVNDAYIAKIAPETFVSVSPLKLPFALQVIGTTSVPRKVALANNGGSALTIHKIYFAGTNPGDFAETNTCADSLASGATCSISISFTPTDKNKRQAALVISDSDPASPQAVALNGPGTVVSLSKGKLSFGNQAVGTTSQPQNVTVTNTGSTQLNFTGIIYTGITITGTNAGDFSETNTCGNSIAAGANCTIAVKFKPTATGTRYAAVSISDDGGGSPQRVVLIGTGT